MRWFGKISLVQTQVAMETYDPSFLCVLRYLYLTKLMCKGTAGFIKINSFALYKILFRERKKQTRTVCKGLVYKIYKELLKIQQ